MSWRQHRMPGALFAEDMLVNGTVAVASSLRAGLDPIAKLRIFAAVINLSQ